jgi:hypothetical protein
VGHATLVPYLWWIAACHEAAHTVAAFRYRVPHFGLLVRVGVDHITDAHLHRDWPAIVLARQLISDRGLPSNRDIVTEFTTFDIAYHVNRRLNGVPVHEAEAYAIDDGDHLAETVELNEWDEETANGFREQSASRCTSLLDNRDFREAVRAVANAIIDNDGRLAENQIANAITGAVGDRLTLAIAEPTHQEIETCAYYLSRGRSSDFDALANWLCAERALRYAAACALPV